MGEEITKENRQLLYNKRKTKGKFDLLRCNSNSQREKKMNVNCTVIISCSVYTLERV